MNVLFLTLLDFESLQESNIYTDLLREFVRNEHHVYVISPIEKRKNIKTHIVREDKATILRLQIGNTQKTNIIEKGISTVLIEPQMKAGIKKYFSKVKFDLVLYSTPPITFTGAVEYVKKRDRAKTYLLLKDIFPQNAVDIGMLRKSGVKGLLYRHFRKQEKHLYKISDRIGCMSKANVEYVLQYNPDVNSRKVEVCPNSVEVVDKSIDEETRNTIRTKYGIPLDKTVYIYGGNLGKPQGVPFIIGCLNKCRNIENAYFLIVGDGTEYHLLEEYQKKYQQQNMKVIRRLSKEDYDIVVAACDVGLIFLDHRFTIPNFPSRLLSYMQAKIPILACTDPHTDIREVITDGGFGWWCESDDANGFRTLIDVININKKAEYGLNGYFYFINNYNVQSSYNIIIDSLKI